jgi:hypothetical protein
VRDNPNSPSFPLIYLEYKPWTFLWQRQIEPILAHRKNNTKKTICKRKRLPVWHHHRHHRCIKIHSPKPPPLLPPLRLPSGRVRTLTRILTPSSSSSCPPCPVAALLRHVAAAVPTHPPARRPRRRTASVSDMRSLDTCAQEDAPGGKVDAGQGLRLRASHLW